MGTELTLTIHEVAFGGSGLGRLPDGRVVFVPFVDVGETVRARVLREHRSYLQASLVAVEAPSTRRVAPTCLYYGRCGGCSYQHLSAAAQLEIKRAQVAGVLRRVGHFTNAEVEVRPAVPSPRDYGYRNRITVHARAGAVGFVAHGATGSGERDIVDVERCPIAEDGVNAGLATLRARPRGRLREGNYTLRADVGPGGGFRQTNDGAAAELLALVQDGVTGAPTHLLDAYCGAGFFARALRDRFASVIGIEWDRRSVDAAARGAAEHERYLCGDVATLLPAELALAADRDAVLIVDPPAEGLPPPVRVAVAAHPPTQMIYVSCDPATLARDLASLRDAYEIASVTPLDMFPQTAEIEGVAVLRRRLRVQ